MPRPHQSQVRLALFDAGVDRSWNPPTVASVIELYLDESRRLVRLGRFDPDRLAEQERYLASFASRWGTKEVRDAGNRDLTTWLSENPDWGTGESLNVAVDAVMACFRWAADPGVREIAASPFTCETESARPTIAQTIAWFDEHYPNKSQSPTADKQVRRVRKLFAAKHGSRYVDDCRPRMLTEFIAANPRIRSDWTRKGWCTTIQTVFNYAAELGFIVRNPFKGASYPEGPRGRDWTDEEFRAMLRASTPLFRRVLVMIRFSGCRPGECRAMEWKDLLETLSRAVLAEGKTKTKSVRTIRTNAVVVKLLVWMRKRWDRKSSFVFLNSRGRTWTISSFDQRVSRIRDKVGLPKDVKLNGGRHTFTTQALVNGVQMPELAVLLGHKSIAMIQKHYSHLSERHDHISEAAEQAIRAKPKGPGKAH